MRICLSWAHRIELWDSQRFPTLLSCLKNVRWSLLWFTILALKGPGCKELNLNSLYHWTGKSSLYLYLFPLFTFTIFKYSGPFLVSWAVSAVVMIYICLDRSGISHLRSSSIAKAVLLKQKAGYNMIDRLSKNIWLLSHLSLEEFRNCAQIQTSAACVNHQCVFCSNI